MFDVEIRYFYYPLEKIIPVQCRLVNHENQISVHCISSKHEDGYSLKLQSFFIDYISTMQGSIFWHILAVVET